MHNPCTRTHFLLYDKTLINVEETVCYIAVILFKLKKTVI